MTLTSKVRFDGTVIMSAASRLVMIREFNLPTYIDAFGDEELAFRKGFQALLPYVRVNQGSQNDMVQLVWPSACRGTVHVTVRGDKPL